MPRCPVLSELLDRNPPVRHVQPQLTLALPGNDLGIQLLRVKVKWYLANYGPFYFDCLGGNGFMGINTKKLSQERVNISKTCFRCQEL